MVDGQEAVARLEAAVEVAQQAVRGVREDQWSAPSTCEGWSVEDVTRHLVEGDERLGAALGGGEASPRTPTPEGSGWVERHRTSASVVVDRLRRPGALEQPVTVPAGTMPGDRVAALRTVESLVHAWDVATSTGRRLSAPDDLVDYADRMTRLLLDRLPPGRTPFGPATTAPPGATPLDRLAALLGRQVPPRH